MKNILIIREGRILLEQSSQSEKLLSLKICVGTSIHKFNQLTWSQPCNRWETPEQIKIGYPKGVPIELQLYYPSKSIPKVVGQATIDNAIFSRHLEEELKIALTYNGMIKGWLYCQIGLEGNGPSKLQSKYLYIHKISFHFLEDYQNQFNLSIFQNTQPIYEKKFILNNTSKTLFPNIKNNIKFSDVVRITLNNTEHSFKMISFLVDNIKRGKTANYQTWLRNKYNNKAGDVKVEYFLENLFLQNDRKVMSRKAVFPKALSRMSGLINQEAVCALKKETKENEKVEEVTEVESTNLSSIDMNTTSGKSFKIKRLDLKTNSTNSTWKNTEPQVKNQNAMPCLKRKATTNKNLGKKQGKKQDFYFQHPFE